jgi:hypothetical protein
VFDFTPFQKRFYNACPVLEFMITHFATTFSQDLVENPFQLETKESQTGLSKV